jgi:F-type H+-transporting ATPase subunit b
VIEPGTLIVSVIGFLLTFLIIRHYGFKPMAKILDERRRYVENQISEAENGRVQAEKILAEQQELLEKTRREVNDMIEAARQRADEQATEIVAQAQEESARMLDEARQLIERERAEALSGVLDRVASLTVEISTKLLHNHVSESVHEEMLTEAEKRLGELVS